MKVLYLKKLFIIISKKLKDIWRRIIINIYGAGLAGLTAAINLARKGYNVTVYEKEKRIGGLGNCTPSVHMTPIHFKKMKEYIGIDVEPCFSELKSFKAYIYSKIVHFNPKYLYLTERGSNKTSLDYYLYKTAQKEGVNFEFSYALTPNIIKSIPDYSIIATGNPSGLSKHLKLRYIPFIHYDSSIKTKIKDNFCLAYFDSNIGGYGYAYIAAKNKLVSAEIDFFLNQPYERYFKKFKKQLKETQNLEFRKWLLVNDNIPEKIHLLKKFHGKTFVIAGALSGFHDPFFGFGVNSALISGKIAALTIVSKKRGMHEFNRFTRDLGKMFILSKIYNHLPLKNIIIPRIFKSVTTSIPIIGSNLKSIPGFTQNDCFKILNIK
jgi:flavin-dependent dehydrogenase